MHFFNLKLTGLLLTLATLFGSVQGQDSLGFYENAPNLNRSRLKAVVLTEAVGYTGTMVMLDQLWYSDYPRSSFHWFNDNQEWLQIDKLGHAATAYYVGYAGMSALEWAGLSRRKALWYGGTLGWVFLTSVEAFDGFSDQWGASSGDLIANTAGFGLLAVQEYAWQEQRIKMKFSAHLTDFAKFRPQVLGLTWNERLLKDYNGQTYWLSANISSFLPDDSRFPDFLNLAVGYGGEGMYFGDPNHALDGAEPVPFAQRYRQYFLSFDIDLAKVRKKKGLLRTALQSFGFIKIPGPTLEYNSQNGLEFHLFYF